MVTQCKVGTLAVGARFEVLGIAYTVSHNDGGKYVSAYPDNEDPDEPFDDPFEFPASEQVWKLKAA